MEFTSQQPFFILASNLCFVAQEKYRKKLRHFYKDEITEISPLSMHISSSNFENSEKFSSSKVVGLTFFSSLDFLRIQSFLLYFLMCTIVNTNAWVIVWIAFKNTLY